MSKVSKFIDTNITHSSQRKKAMEAVQEQINFYKNQSAMVQKEIDRVKGEEDASKRRLDEKKVRQLRRKYRSPGFLAEPADGLREKLG